MNAVYHLKGSKDGAIGVLITVDNNRDGYRLVTCDNDVKEDGANGRRWANEYNIDNGKTEMQNLGKDGYTITRGADIVVGSC
jgi:hypothetical protein